MQNQISLNKRPNAIVSTT